MLSVFDQISADYGLALQVTMVGVSFLGLASYYVGYRIADRKATKETFTTAGYFCFFGAFTSLVWLVLPFLPQPRFGVFGDVGHLIPGVATQIFGLGVFIAFMAFTVRATKSNWSVTYDRFFAPERLITTGEYGVIRHPMLMGDFLAHAGLALLSGAVYTTVLIPVYYLLTELFIEIQERYVLRKEFPEEYAKYTRTTPRSWSGLTTVLAGAGALLFCLTLIFH